MVIVNSFEISEESLNRFIKNYGQINARINSIGYSVGCFPDFSQIVCSGQQEGMEQRILGILSSYCVKAKLNIVAYG